MARLLGLILLLPVLELLAFLLVGGAIGFGKAILLQLAISLIGVAMLGSLVSEAKAKARREGGLLSLALDKSHGVRGLAGLLFVIPGFLTDILGLLALAPEFRARLRRVIGGGEAKRQEPRVRPRPASGELLDLDARDWREVEPAGRQ